MRTKLLQMITCFILVGYASNSVVLNANEIDFHVQGKVVDTTGKPVEGAIVQSFLAFPAFGSHPDITVTKTFSNSDGFFEIGIPKTQLGVNLFAYTSDCC